MILKHSYPVMLPGNPTKVEADDWLDPSKKIGISQVPNGIEVEIKLEGLAQKHYVHGAEMLMAMLHNNPRDVRIGIVCPDYNEAELVLFANNSVVARLGRIPSFLSLLFIKNWEPLIENRALWVNKVSVDMATIGSEADRNMMMEGADIVEAMTDEDFSEFMGEMIETLKSVVYVVRVGFQVDKRHTVSQEMLLGT